MVKFVNKDFLLSCRTDFYVINNNKMETINWIPQAITTEWHVLTHSNHQLCQFYLFFFTFTIHNLNFSNYWFIVNEFILYRFVNYQTLDLILKNKGLHFLVEG
jgi:hypothetical protein